MVQKQSKIKAWEIDRIANLLSSGVSVRGVGRELGRSHSSILAEIKRNSFEGEYQAIKAQEKSQKRNTESRRFNPLKSPEIYSHVHEKLRDGWSPEEIAGRAKRDNDGVTVICHETIYKHIYDDPVVKKEFVQYLVMKHQKRRKWYGRKGYQKGIQNRVSIKERDDIINQNTQFGHWEVDVVEGKAHLMGIQTFLERKSRFYQAILMENVDSEFGIKAQLDLFSQLPKTARLSATFDNGRENYNHTKLKIQLGMKTFFCDPNCPWQKGSNENHNGVLRRYIPKRTDLTSVSQTELDAIVQEINDRPRKCLGYETPSEAFNRELQC
jgi:IS30 family transposase